MHLLTSIDWTGHMMSCIYVSGYQECRKSWPPTRFQRLCIKPKRNKSRREGEIFVSDLNSRADPVVVSGMFYLVVITECPQATCVSACHRINNE